MPPLKPVPTLFDHCTKAVETLVETQMLEVSDYVVKYLFFDENEAAIRDIDETQVGNNFMIALRFISFNYSCCSSRWCDDDGEKSINSR